MKVKAFAKINLCLDVLSRRADGYHDVEMVMTNVDIADVLEIRELEEKKISLICNNKDLATDETNLIYRAIVLLQKETKKDFGVEVRLEKNIPMEASDSDFPQECSFQLYLLSHYFQKMAYAFPSLWNNLIFSTQHFCTASKASTIISLVW